MRSTKKQRDEDKLTISRFISLTLVKGRTTYSFDLTLLNRKKWKKIEIIFLRCGFRGKA